MEPIKRLSIGVERHPPSLRELPDFLFFEIFTYLSSVQVCTTRLVCRRWKQIAEDRLIWKKLFRKEFPLAFPNLSPEIDFLEVYCSIQRKIKVSSQIRFNKYRVEEERKIVHPRFKWPWVFGTNGRSLVLWDAENKKTHLLQLETFFHEEKPVLQPLGIKRGFIYVKTSHPLANNEYTLHEVNILKGTIARSFKTPRVIGRMLHFKKMALYYVVHQVVHVWLLATQTDTVLIQKNHRIVSMLIKGNCIAVSMDDRSIDLHNRVTGALLHSLAAPGQFMALGKCLNRGELFFMLNREKQMIEAREVSTLNIMTSYYFGVVTQGFTQSELSEVVVDEDFLVVKVVHTLAPPVQGHADKQTTLEFFDLETGSSISVIKFDKEPFGLFFKSGKIFYQIRENVAGKEKFKSVWVDFSNEKSLKRTGCVIS